MVRAAATRRRALLGAALVLLFAGVPSAAWADACRVLIYQFQPVKLDDAHELPVGSDNHIPPQGIFEEGGPQVAIWLESPPQAGGPPAQRGLFLSDIFVTARTAIYGIGNRPGNGQFVSSPRFPYGNRDNVLPVWAWARAHDHPARQFPLLVMQDGYDSSFGFHESSSSAENFYCRPLQRSEIVDALTCPTATFSSDKGKDGPATSLYPPRHDVAATDCRVRGTSNCSGCYDDVACAHLAERSAEVAAVSGATPSPYAPAVPGMWMVPGDLPDGEYWIFLEVNKQYDQDAPKCPGGTDAECPAYAPTCDSSSHFCARYPSFYDARLPSYGVGANIGQPSVVWATKVQLSAYGTSTSVADEYIGYGDWDHPRGNLFPPDATISHTPGSGAARLARFTDQDGSWRFKVQSHGCGQCDQAPVPPPITDLVAMAPAGDTIQVSFTQVGFGTAPVSGYQIKYRLGTSMSDVEFATSSTPGPTIAATAPGTPVSFTLTQHDGIQAQRTFMIGVRSEGDCMKTSPLATVQVTTPRQKFTTIDGCFIATAAFGSDLAPEVATLRRFRDRFLARHEVGRALIALYYEASPPLARLIAKRAELRAGVRALLRPGVAMARAALHLTPKKGDL